MRAIVFHEFGGPDVVQIAHVPLPQIEPDEVLVRVRAAALNRLDLQIQAGQTPTQPRLPHIGGSEVAGEVALLGSQVKGFELGQPVVVAPYFPKADASAGEEITYLNSNLLGLDRAGGFAEYVKVLGSSLVKIPEELSFEEAAAQTLTTMAAWRMLVSKAGVRPGETVLVLAAGSGVGSAAIQIAKLWGAQVIATASSQTKLEKAQAAGADQVINTETHDFVQEVRRLTAGRGADIVVEHIGQATWTRSIECVAANGRLVTGGATTGSAGQVNIWDLYNRQIMLIGSYGGTKDDLKEILRFTSEGRLNASIDKVFPLEQVQVAQERLIAREQYGKIVLTP